MDANEYENNHLVELGDSDYEIVDGEPDIKGWDVKNEQGQKIGEVDELLFDPETNKARYIIVDLDDNDLELEEDKKIMIPIGIAELYNSDDETEDDETEDETSAGSEYEGETEEDNDAFEKKDSTVVDDFETDEDDDNENEVYDAAYDGDVVIIPATLEQLRELPAYEKDNVSPEAESTIRRIFEGSGVESSLVYNRNNFYQHEHFNESNYFDRSAATDTVMPGDDYDENLGNQDAKTGLSGNAPTQDSFPDNMAAGTGSIDHDSIKNRYPGTEESNDLDEK